MNGNNEYEKNIGSKELYDIGKSSISIPIKFLKKDDEEKLSDVEESEDDYIYAPPDYSEEELEHIDLDITGIDYKSLTPLMKFQSTGGENQLITITPDEEECEDYYIYTPPDYSEEDLHHIDLDITGIDYKSLTPLMVFQSDEESKSKVALKQKVEVTDQGVFKKRITGDDKGHLESDLLHKEESEKRNTEVGLNTYQNSLKSKRERQNQIKENNYIDLGNSFSLSEDEMKTDKLVRSQFEILRDLRIEDYYAKYSGHLFEIISKVYIYDHLGKNLFYQIRCVDIKTSKEKTTLISAMSFQKEDWIHLQFGLHVRIGPEINAYKVIKANCSEGLKYNVHTIHKRKQTGWFKRKKIPGYAFGKSILGAIPSDVVADCKDNIDYSKKVSNLKALKHVEKMFDITSGDEVKVMLAHNILGLLTTLFKEAGHKPRYLLWIVGATGSYKTSISKEVFIVITDDDFDHIPASFRDTPSGIEYKAALNSDRVLLIDDYYPALSKNERDKLFHIVDHIVRLYGDDIVRTRMNATMSRQQEFRPRGIAAVTAEDVLKGKSFKSRCVELFLEKDSVDLDQLTYIQNNKTVYKTFVFHFLTYISENYYEIVNRIKSQMDIIRQNYSNEFAHGRLLDSFALLNVAYGLYNDYCLDVGFKSSEEVEEDNYKTMNSFLNVVTDMNKELQITDPAIMYMQAFDQLLNSNSINITKEECDSFKRVGYEDEDYFYLIPDVMFNEVVRFYRSQNIEFTINQTTLHKELKELGVLITGKDRISVRKQPKGIKVEGRPRYLMFIKSKLYTLIGD